MGPSVGTGSVGGPVGSVVLQCGWWQMPPCVDATDCCLVGLVEGNWLQNSSVLKLVLGQCGQSQGPKDSGAVYLLAGEAKFLGLVPDCWPEERFLKLCCRVQDPRACFRSLALRKGQFLTQLGMESRV